MVANEQVLLQVGYFLKSSPEPLPNWKIEVEVNYKKPNRHSSVGTRVQRCKQSMFQRPAPLAAIPLLAAVLIKGSIFFCEFKYLF
jgi:hypothetical protein